MNTVLLHTILSKFRRNFLAFFTILTEQDYQALQAGSSEGLLDLLQERYGYTRAQAKAAWNEFVLRYVDGHEVKRRACPARLGALTDGRSPRRVRKQERWWLPYPCERLRKVRF
jgi:hypothetical protein